MNLILNRLIYFYKFIYIIWINSRQCSYPMFKRKLANVESRRKWIPLQRFLWPRNLSKWQLTPPPNVIRLLPNICWISLTKSNRIKKPRCKLGGSTKIKPANFQMMIIHLPIRIPTNPSMIKNSNTSKNFGSRNPLLFRSLIGKFFPNESYP